LRWQLPYLNTTIKPIELVGAFKIASVVGVLLGLVGVLLIGWAIFYIFFAAIFIPAFFSTYASSVIMDEDMEIERDFPDLFLLLYNRLTKGAYTRLAPTLEDFIASLDSMNNRGSGKAIRNFVVDIRNNIEIYGDDSIAIGKSRGRYRSAMVINFINLAIQSLSGVDNKDKLLAFKVELSQNAMKS